MRKSYENDGQPEIKKKECDKDKRTQRINKAKQTKRKTVRKELKA